MVFYVSTPDRLNVYPRAPRDDPSAYRPPVDPTIRGVHLEEPRRQLKQHPRPRTEATSSSVVSRNHSFRQHNLRRTLQRHLQNCSRDVSAFARRIPGGPESTSKAYRLAGAPLDTAAPTVVHLPLCNWETVLRTSVSAVVWQILNAASAVDVQRIAHNSIRFPSRYGRNSPKGIFPPFFCPVLRVGMQLALITSDTPR